MKKDVVGDLATIKLVSGSTLTIAKASGRDRVFLAGFSGPTRYVYVERRNMIRLLYIPRQELKTGKTCPKMVVLETDDRRIFLALSDMRDFLKARRLPLQTARR